MGVYEVITGITESEENLKVEIRQTEGTLKGNLVYIKNTKTNRAYSFTLADGDEYGADAMTRNAVAKLHSDMCGCNAEYLREAGIEVPKVTLKLDKKRRREDGMRWN